ncbi:MAG: SCO family protein [Flavipsychrobacter sp.]
MKIKKSAVFLIVFFIALGTGFVWWAMGEHNKRPKALPIIGQPGHKAKDFSFTDQEGNTITKADVAGNILVVEYFFTTCKGICPKMNENMNTVYEAYKGYPNVKILSHTVDPVKDTVAAMKAYSLRFEADPKQWLFLTGDKKALYDAARFSYLVTAADDTGTVDIASDFIHTDRFVLVDEDGYIRGQYKGTDTAEVQKLIGAIDQLLKEAKEEETKH